MDIEPLHQFAYDDGADPIEWAVRLAQIQIEVCDTIRAARAHWPSAYPIFKGGLGPDAVARRIIAELLNAGWSPPQPIADLFGGDD